MNEFEIIYYKNNEKISTETTVACNRFCAEMYADETCKKMNKIEGEGWTFSCRQLSEY